MKHIVTIVQNDSITASYIFDTKEAAMSRFHTEMASGHASGTTTLCSVMSANGALVVVDKFTAQPASSEDGEGE